jgi:hypothetical protein
MYTYSSAADQRTARGVHLRRTGCIICIGVISVVIYYNCVYYCDTYLLGRPPVCSLCRARGSAPPYLWRPERYVYVIWHRIIGIVSVVSQYNCDY